MNCECEACLEDIETPPVDFVSDRDWLYEAAMDACWQDMGDSE